MVHTLLQMAYSHSQEVSIGCFKESGIGGRNPGEILGSCFDIQIVISILTKMEASVASLRIRAMPEANTALLDILVDNSVIIPSFQNRTSTFLNNGL